MTCRTGAPWKLNPRSPKPIRKSTADSSGLVCSPKRVRNKPLQDYGLSGGPAGAKKTALKHHAVLSQALSCVEHEGKRKTVHLRYFNDARPFRYCYQDHLWASRHSMWSEVCQLQVEAIRPVRMMQQSKSAVARAIQAAPASLQKSCNKIIQPVDFWEKRR